MNDFFAERAGVWDANPERAGMTAAFCRELAAERAFGSETVAMDFGCGTGLVGLTLAPDIRRIFMTDTSPAMLAVLKEKIASGGYENVEVLPDFPEPGQLPGPGLDLVVSMMAFHHIEDLGGTLGKLHGVLRPGGVLAVGDLLPEDGSFHGAMAVPHKGFDPVRLAELFRDAGFSVGMVREHHVMTKKDADGEIREYGQFFLLGRKK